MENECPWCGETIFDDQPVAPHNGDRMHFSCAAEAREDEAFDRDMGFA